MLGNNVVDYMINSCKGAYNLENAKLIKKNVEDKKVQFVFKRSDLKLKKKETYHLKQVPFQELYIIIS